MRIVDTVPADAIDHAEQLEKDLSSAPVERHDMFPEAEYLPAVDYVCTQVENSTIVRVREIEGLISELQTLKRSLIIQQDRTVRGIRKHFAGLEQSKEFASVVLGGLNRLRDNIVLFEDEQ